MTTAPAHDAHRAEIRWRRTSADFRYDSYNREHDWVFGSGVRVPASAAPAYRGLPGSVNPEEALVAALSSCHMLTLLAIAARKGYTVDAYSDDAEGFLDKNARGRLALQRVTLRPRITWGGDRRPDATELASLHRQAHEGCFIANSVTTEITVEPEPSPGPGAAPAPQP